MLIEIGVLILQLLKVIILILLLFMLDLFRGFVRVSFLQSEMPYSVLITEGLDTANVLKIL